MRPLYVLLLLATAVPAAHAQAPDTADLVRLDFNWPARTTAAVHASRTKIRFGDFGADTTMTRASYRLALEEAGDGYVVRYSDFSAPGAANGSLQAALNRQLVGLVPSYVVSPEGEFLRIEDPARLRRSLDSMIAPMLAGLEETGEDPRAMFAAITSDEMLTSLAAQEWNALVGNWSGAELEIGSAYGSESVERVPIFGGMDIPMIYEFGATGRVPCDDADTALACVELLMTSEPEAEAATAMVRKLLGAGLPAMADSLRDARLTIWNEIRLVTHAETMLPYRLTITKDVAIELPGQSGAQVDVRELRFRYPGAPVEPTSPAEWTDASRLTLGIDSLRIYAVRNGAREDVGVVRDELVRTETDGVPVLRRTYRTTNSLFGDHHQVSQMRYPTFQALGDRTTLGTIESDIAFRADSVTGWYQRPDGTRVDVALAAHVPTYDAHVVDLMVRAADLAPGFHRAFEAFLVTRQVYAPMEIRVIGSASVPGVGGAPAESWVVELEFDGMGSTMWVDKQTRALHRQVIRVAPGLEMVMERH